MMSHADGNNSGDDGRTPQERRALGALLDLPRPEPSAEARRRARTVFLRGEAPDAVADVVADADAGPTGPPASAAEGPSHRWLGWALAATVVLAALAGFWYGGQPQYEWIVTDVVAPEGIGADGAVAKGHVFTAGRVTTGPESEIELQLGDQLRFRMMPGSSLDLPRPPRRWLPGAQVIAVQTGEIYGTTGGRPLAAPFHIAALQAEARLTGTTFAVFQDERGTCVCLWDGAIVVVPFNAETPVSMETESKYYVYPDGTNSGMIPLDDMERMKLSMMAEGGILELPSTR
jgi:ferric-dicitrate binding protein FerR (iron transport regulator)